MKVNSSFRDGKIIMYRTKFLDVIAAFVRGTKGGNS